MLIFHLFVDDLFPSLKVLRIFLSKVLCNLIITCFTVALFFFLIYFWLCWVFASMRGLSLVAASRATLHRGAWASHYRGLSCCGAQAPDPQAQ